MNQTEVAIALRYDPAGDDLPRVTASGRGAIARQMLAVAERHGVAVQHDRALADLLRPLEVGTRFRSRPLPPWLKSWRTSTAPTGRSPAGTALEQGARSRRARSAARRAQEGAGAQ